VLRYALGFLRNSAEGKKYYARLERKHGKGKALTVLGHRLARAVSEPDSPCRSYESALGKSASCRRFGSYGDVTSS
jgi:hypothetical protein